MKGDYVVRYRKEYFTPDAPDSPPPMNEFLSAVEAAREAGAILRASSIAQRKFPTKAKWISSRNRIAAPKR